MTRKEYLFLLLIIIVGIIFRFFSINWDMNYHFHPDERAIILYTLPLQFPHTINEFFSSQSSWNPHFFAYGSFPLYLLKIVASFLAFIDISHAGYDGITILGRFLSGCFDIGTILVIFLLGKNVYNKSVGFLAAIFYTFSVLPIQLSHFYAVDTLLTFFITLILYKLCTFYDHPNKKSAIAIGIVLGFALATKISAIVIVFSIIITFCIDFFLMFMKSSHKPTQWRKDIPVFLKRFVTYGSLLFLGTLFSYMLLEPYAFIDYQSFLTQSLQQAEMTKNAFTFPYTLQYVGKIAYVYELINIFFWGLGPIIGFFAFIGVGVFIWNMFSSSQRNRNKMYIIFSFFLIYFLLVGNFAIGFMRYMLPLYPLFCLFAAVSVQQYIFEKMGSKKNIKITLLVFLLLLISLWPLSFLSIYTKPSSRIQATNWILEHIPSGKTLAIEHWDDALPIYGQERYRIETLELYNPDTPEKWDKIRQQLEQTDYIILASNRLSVPLQKLTYCQSLPQQYCYQKTAAYYKALFNGSLGYKKVAQFHITPTTPLFSFPINDESADESFTVYDHPKIMIFQKF